MSPSSPRPFAGLPFSERRRPRLPEGGQTGALKLSTGLHREKCVQGQPVDRPDGLQSQVGLCSVRKPVLPACPSPHPHLSLWPPEEKDWNSSWGSCSQLCSHREAMLARRLCFQPSFSSCEMGVIIPTTQGQVGVGAGQEACGAEEQEASRTGHLGYILAPLLLSAWL